MNRTATRIVLATAALGLLVASTQSAVAAVQHRVVAGQHRAVAGAPARPAAVRYQSVKVMTYNILELTRDGKRDNGHIVPPWSERRPKAAALVRSARPDVVAIEEGAPLIGHTRQRQVDSLRSAIGGSYRVARTEIPPSQPHYFRTGVNIIYNSATERPVGKGGHYGLGQNRWAAYQEFASRSTGAKFLFVATHLLVGRGRTDDLTRETETNTLIVKATTIASRRGVPVFYAGDFNSANPASDKKFTINGAGVAMSQHGAKDALVVAPKRVNAAYNSANDLFRKAPRSNDHIDHIYAPKGIRVASAGLVLRLRHGRFIGVIPSDHNPLWAVLRYPY